MTLLSESRKTVRREVRILRDPSELAAAAAELFVAEAREAVVRHGRFDVLLSGGSTPCATYEAIAGRASEVDWARTHLFWGDERIVPADHPDSNYRMARERLIDRIPIPPENAHRVPTELIDPRGIAQSYELALRRHFQSGWKVPEFPRFHLSFLGIGPDGHTASLFPEGSPGEEGPAWVIAPFAPKLRRFRVSVTYGVLNASGIALYLVTEESKAAVLGEVLSRRAPMKPVLPAARVQPMNGRLIYLLTPAAARLLPESVIEASNVDRQTARRASGF